MLPNGLELSCPAARATVDSFSRIPAGKSRSNFPLASRVSCSELLGMPQVGQPLLEDLLRFRGGVTCGLIELVGPGPASVAPNSEYGAPRLSRPLLGPRHEGLTDPSPPAALVDYYAAELCEGWNKEASRHEGVQPGADAAVFVFGD